MPLHFAKHDEHNSWSLGTISVKEAETVDNVKIGGGYGRGNYIDSGELNGSGKTTPTMMSSNVIAVLSVFVCTASRIASAPSAPIGFWPTYEKRKIFILIKKDAFRENAK